MTAARQELTEAELRTAWLHVHRDTWPATFEEAMEHPTLSRLVMLTARHPPRAIRTPAATPAPRVDRVQQPRDRHSRPLRGAAPAVLDRKRAAAGDRDED